MKKIYLVRQVLLSDDYGACRIDEEAVFPSYDEAILYLRELQEKNPSDKILLKFRNELLEMYIGNSDGLPCKKSIYSITGKLLEEIDYSKSKSYPDRRYTYKGKFAIGDLVYIKSKLEDVLSPFVMGSYGVIHDAPLTKQEWLDKGEEEGDWMPTYIVIYITSDTGIANHKHIEEIVMQHAKSADLPKEYDFLDKYSRHLKGKEHLPDKLINNLLLDKVYLKRGKFFDIDSKKIYCT